MSQYTVLSDLDLQTIIAHYPVGKIVSHKVLRGGSQNTNYLITTSTNTLVLTICEQKSLEETKELASLLVYLDHHQFATSKLIKTNNDALVVIWQDKPVMLKAFIEGEFIEDLSQKQLVYLGKELAKLHKIEAPEYLPHAVAYGKECFDEVLAYAPDSTFYRWLKDTQGYIENNISPALPKAMIHSDIFSDNIIMTKDRTHGIIMDFEEACYYYRVFDIGMMIVGTCCEGETVHLQKVTSLLSGYEQEITLLDVEKRALQAFAVYAAAATAFWRHQHFNYTNIIPEKKDHYIAMKRLADAIRSLSDTSFV